MKLIVTLFALCLLSAPRTMAQKSAEVTVVVNADSRDTDGDTVFDGLDNCWLLANPGQEDLDGDGIGNPCDADADGDHIVGQRDPCPAVANKRTRGLVGSLKEFGIRLSWPIRGKNITDRAEQVSGWVANDLDTDKTCMNLDSDGDGIVDSQDRCPFWKTASDQKLDLDADGLGDACDPNPNAPETRAEKVQTPSPPSSREKFARAQPTGQSSRLGR